MEALLVEPTDRAPLPAEHGCSRAAVTTGWLRTEMMLDHFGVTEDNRRDATRRLRVEDEPGPADISMAESPSWSAGPSRHWPVIPTRAAGTSGLSGRYRRTLCRPTIPACGCRITSSCRSPRPVSSWKCSTSPLRRPRPMRRAPLSGCVAHDHLEAVARARRPSRRRRRGVGSTYDDAADGRGSAFPGGG